MKHLEPRREYGWRLILRNRVTVARDFPIHSMDVSLRRFLRPRSARLRRDLLRLILWRMVGRAGDSGATEGADAPISSSGTAAETRNATVRRSTAWEQQKQSSGSVPPR